MNLNKHIFIIDEHVSSKQNGVGTYMRQLMSCLKSTNLDELALISFNAEQKDFSIQKKDGITHYEFPSFAGGDFLGYGGLSLPILRQYVEDSDNNVFFVNHSPCVKFLKQLRELFPKSKVVFTIHDQGWTAPLLGEPEYLKTLVDSRIQENLNRKSLPKFIDKSTRAFVRKYFQEEQRMYRIADAVICLSPSTKQLVEKIYGISKAKLYLIPNGLGEPISKHRPVMKANARKQLNVSDTDKIFLFVGRPVKAKGIEVLLKSFENISHQYPECRLVITGECHQANNFVKLVPHSCSRVTFTGQIPQHAVALWYNAADFGMLPSYTEQCSYTGLEMMAYGLPVITTDGHGLVDMFRDGYNAIVTQIGDREDETFFVEGLTFAMDRALRLSDEDIQLYVRNGLSSVHNQYTTMQMQNLYRSFLVTL